MRALLHDGRSGSRRRSRDRGRGSAPILTFVQTGRRARRIRIGSRRWASVANTGSASYPWNTQSRARPGSVYETSCSPIAQLVASPATLASWATWPPTRFAVVARVVDVLAGGPIRGGLQAHDAVAPLDAAATGADGRVAATETNGRGVCGDRRRPRSQMTKRKARVHVTTALWPGRSGAGEGVGAGRRPAAVEIGDGRRCGPSCGL
jgi:hypothetical protein